MEKLVAIEIEAEITIGIESRGTETGKYQLVEVFRDPCSMPRAIILQIQGFVTAQCVLQVVEALSDRICNR